MAAVAKRCQDKIMEALEQIEKLLTRQKCESWRDRQRMSCRTTVWRQKQHRPLTVLIFLLVPFCVRAWLGIRGREDSVDRAGAGSGSPGEFSDVTLYCPKYTRVRYTRDKQSPARVSTRTITRLDHRYTMKLSTLTCHSATQTPRAYCFYTPVVADTSQKAHDHSLRPPSLWLPSRASSVEGVARLASFLT